MTRAMPASLRVALAVAFLLLAAVGALVVDDYGVSWDEPAKHRLAEETAAYVLDGDDAVLGNGIRNDGVVFELGLLAAARVLGLEDSRDKYLAYHLLSHLFFLLAGTACAALAYRVTGSRAAACIALLLFVLHPRLYAHSFFNSKDIPFLGMFMICLWLVEGAFRRDTLGAFALCGAAAALAFNTRVMAFVLVLAVVGMRALDWWFARGRAAERRHVLATTALFLLVAAAAAYATWPRLWADPLGGVFEAFRWVLREAPVFSLFQGEIISAGGTPRRYLPTWMGLTTPPLTLALGLLGSALALRRFARRRGEALRNTPLRFECLCFVAFWGSVAALVAAGANIYDGWRPLFFLHAPFAVLGALGVGGALAMLRGRRTRLCAAGLALAGTASTALAMKEVHPYENVYFNLFVDRETPQRLSERYEMDYWGTSYREALEFLLRLRPGSDMHVASYEDRLLEANRAILPPADRARIVVGSNEAVGFYVTNHRERHWTGGAADRIAAPVVYSREVYNSAVLSIAAVNVALVDEATERDYRRRYEAARAGTPVAEWDFSFFLDGPEAHLVKNLCRPADTRSRLALDVWPAAPAQPVALEEARARSEAGGARLWIHFGTHGVWLDGACWVQALLPYRPGRLRATAQELPGKRTTWAGDASLGSG